MKVSVWWVFVCLCLMPVWGVAEPLAKIMLKDGSRIYGEILEMTGGMIKVKTLFHDGDPIKIQWSEVVGINSKDPMAFVLSNGIILKGAPTMQDSGALGIKTDLLTEPIPVQVDSVIAVNPPVKKALVYTGNLNFGASVTKGNTIKILSIPKIAIL
ncbi:MAG: hypothetical protein VST67_12285 [Nitrospirota bacterium]|nr:hypothetical protein [Nitrospirota bacterium]